MKVIIAGSREIVDYSLVDSAVKESGFDVTHVISGGARGIDALGEKYAKENNKLCEVVSADWDVYGKAAGYLRNEKMAQRADALVAVWDGKSKGTRNMISIAQRYNLKTYVKRTDIAPTELGI